MYVKSPLDLERCGVIERYILYNLSNGNQCLVWWCMTPRYLASFISYCEDSNVPSFSIQDLIL